MADDKDWTWVLERKCGECNFDATATSPTRLPELFVLNALEWQLILTAPARGAGGASSGAASRDWLTERHSPNEWSPLEYACHVRDVHHLFQARLGDMLLTDNPTFADWDGDVAAAEGAYNQQSPRAVAQALLEAARKTADQHAAIGEDQRRRPGRRSNGSTFTVASLGLYHLHDAVHHLADVHRIATERAIG